MYRHRLGSLPVIDSAGRLIGIISRGDVLDGFTRPDADIYREVVRDVIARQFLLNPQALTVRVRDGMVTLSGRPECDQVGRLLAAAVRRVEGVVGLRDQMRYTAGRTAAWTVLPPSAALVKRAVLALALAFPSIRPMTCSASQAAVRHGAPVVEGQQVCGRLEPVSPGVSGWR
jgi:CBS domain-containing protein